MLPYENTDLVNRYFGRFIKALVDAYHKAPFEGNFIKAATNPGTLEKRLQRVERLGITQAIVNEVGFTDDPEELDRRLMDAWAEIRTADQLRKESFSGIEKVKSYADLKAHRPDAPYVFQVKRVKGSLVNEINKIGRREQSPVRESSPYGQVGDIHSRLDAPTGYLFWDALLEKNAGFKSLQDRSSQRCLVIVSGDEQLQDPMVRHIACQQLRASFHDLAFGKVYFDELLWLPDLGNGAWFTISTDTKSTRCFADWQDQNFDQGDRDEEEVQRREVDLDSPIDRWIDE